MAAGHILSSKMAQTTAGVSVQPSDRPTTPGQRILAVLYSQHYQRPPNPTPNPLTAGLHVTGVEFPLHVGLALLARVPFELSIPWSV